MKTLDEVIFEVPYTMTPWEENAIYYLKEYRDHMKNEIIELQQEVKKQKEIIEFLEKPLTWDELKQMEGKPVWVENRFFKKWLIVMHMNDDNIIFDGNGYYTWEFQIDFGKAWQAYRKEHHENAR